MHPKETHTAFDSSHPVVPAVFLCGMLALTMFSLQPVLVIISLVGAIAFSLIGRGAAATGRSLSWQLPVACILALANPIFSASGSTPLLRVGPMAIYLESLVYGACMGAMLAAVVLWFEDAAVILPSDKILSLLGGRTPTVALMVSMTAKLVPELVGRGAEVRDAVAAVSLSRPVTRRERIAAGARTSGVLMSWSLADSLETADSMRARGWGAAVRRTSYRPYRFSDADGASLLAICLSLAVCAFLAWTACSQYRFYPTFSVLIFWWGYVPYAVFALVPTILAAWEVRSWRF